MGTRNGVKLWLMLVTPRSVITTYNPHEDTGIWNLQCRCDLLYHSQLLSVPMAPIINYFGNWWSVPFLKTVYYPVEVLNTAFEISWNLFCSFSHHGLLCVSLCFIWCLKSFHSKLLKRSFGCKQVTISVSLAHRKDGQWPNSRKSCQAGGRPV